MGKAGDRARTGDIQLGRLTLYQLSYSRVSLVNLIDLPPIARRLVEGSGLEPL